MPWKTIDGGKNWKPCGEYSPVGHTSAQALPKWHDGTLYWLTETGLITTSDKGETWKKIGEVKDAQYGPIFGKELRVTSRRRRTWRPATPSVAPPRRPVS